MRIGPLFHWSPRARRDSIRREGLLPFSRPVCHSGKKDGVELGSPYLCFGTSPSSAWGYSGDTLGETDHEEWDLWQVWLIKTDSVHVLPTWGQEINEVRLYGPVAAERLWYVATRGVPGFEPLPPQPKVKTRRAKRNP